MPLAPSVANNCGNTVLTMQAPPPYADVTYYWQSTATGTSTANTAQNLTMTSGTVYYIRAKDNVNLCWGQAYTVNYTVNQVPGQATGSNVSRCGSGNVDLIASPGSNGDTVRWYTAPTGGGVLATNTTYTVAVASTTTYYAETYNTATGCIAATRTPITAEVVPLVTYYLDADNDGHAVSSMDACSNPGAGYTTTVMPVDDCDDTNDTILGPLTWFLDADADGYPADLNTYYQCTSPGANYRAGPFSLSLDCDDNNPNSFPIKWYEDTDGDGLGNRRGNFVEQCSAPLTGGPWVTNNNDLCPDDPTNSCTILSSGPSYGPNYVYVRQYQKSASEMLAQESIDQTNFPFFTASEGVIQSITYYDGIGRASQQIGMDQSPVINAQKQDFVTHLEYDAYGRMTREYLPYSTSSGTMGSFRNDALTGTLSFYNTATFENTANPYSEKQFDGTPLNRLEKQGAPGAAWQIQSSGDDHSIEFDYHANTGTEVRRFEVDLTTGTDLVLDENGPNEYYAAHVLVKTITMDENHISGKNHTTEEFTDKSGRVVLKRTYADTDITGDGIPESEVAHDTYYVYDDYGNLTFVLSPQMKATTATFANIQSALDDLGYQYVYDSRNRLVEKKIPGKGWEYIVYNRLDQPIMTQDAMMRAANNTALTSDNWLFTKYDKFGRIAYTGKATATSGTTRTAIQNQVNGLTGDLWVNRTGSYFTMDGLNVYYDQGGYPDNAITSPEAVVDELLTVNYYDDYNFDRAGAPTSVTVFGQTSTSATKGLATGSHVKVLETTNWTTGVTYYDAKARAIRTITNNNYLGTTDEVSSLLDFAGKVLKVRTSHTKSATTIVTIDNYMYDHSGRLMSQTQCIGDVTMGDSCPSTAGATELIALNDYDAIGRLVSKKVGGDAATTVSSSAGLQTVDYEYNVRGWLKSINDTNLTDSALSLDSNDVWGFKIKYDDIADPNKQLFNGNISQTLWASSTSNPAPYNPVSHTYTFTYDAMNRLTDAADNTTNYSVGSLAYDLNGNILALSRQGHTNSGATSFGVMDELVYTYNDGNQLVKVLDNGDDTYGFKDVVDQATEYTYDANGNMVTDANKGITSITYNHLNLPATIVTSNGTISYVYDAVGTKLKKTAPSAVTEYAGNYIYQNGTLQFMGQSEGYITPNGMTGYDYVYQYKDHLGNIRLSYLDNGGTLEIVEENNYYPFGLKHKGYNNPPISPLGNNVAQKWNYNGTELDETSELYEMPLRRYDPAIVRWTSIDPVVHYDYSGYQAYDNNPVFWSDPSGADSKHDFLKDNQGRDKFDSFTGLYISPYERNPSSGQKIIDKVASKTLKTFANGIVTYNGEDIELGKLSENEKNYYFKNDSAITVAILLWEFASGAGRETREFTYGTHPFANAVMTNRYIAEVVARFIASGKKAGLSLHDLVESGQELEFGMPFSPDHTNFFDSLEKHVDAITGNLSQLFIGGANAKVSIRDGNINIMISNGTTRNSLLLHLDDRLKDHTDYFRNYDRSTDGNIPLSTIYQNLFYSNKVTIE
jgi:RHS repeat-associated protein